MRRSVRIGFLGGLTIGAALVYFLDPLQGRRRRENARTRAVRSWGTAKDLASRTTRDLARSSHVVRCRARSLFGDRTADDDLLAHRVRSLLGRIVANPASIEVTAEQGGVTVKGPIHAWEVGPVLAEIGRVRGVSRIFNRLEPHERGETVPGLERAETEPHRPSPDRWTPPTRLVVATAGAGMFARGVRRRGMVGLVLKTAGLTAMARSVSNVSLQRLTGVEAVRSVFRYRRSLTIDAPVERVFALWSNIENFPIILSHVRQVTDLGRGRSRWTAQGPAGLLEWNTVVTRIVPDRTLAWRSEAGAPMPIAGMVRFDSLPGGRTRIAVELSYSPPGTAVGNTVGALFGSDPTAALDEDLARIKLLLEEVTSETRAPAPSFEIPGDRAVEGPSHSLDH